MRTPRGRETAKLAFKHLNKEFKSSQRTFLNTLSMHNYYSIENLTLDIKTKAKNLGFMSCGISEAGF